MSTTRLSARKLCDSALAPTAAETDLYQSGEMVADVPITGIVLPPFCCLTSDRKAASAGPEGLGEDHVGMRREDLRGLGAERRRLEVEGLVRDERLVGLLDGGDGGADERLRPDVVSERERDPLVVLAEVRDRDHRVRLGEVGRHEAVEVGEVHVVELRLAGHPEGDGLLRVDDRDDRGRLIRGQTDHEREVRCRRVELADGRNRVGGIAAGVDRLAVDLASVDAAGLVDCVRGGIARDEVGRARAPRRRR